ncbi:DUF5362 family protein [Pontibacter indicus]|uniref:DUF5362 domain-containing protein n=1 Tax=Pontibacter indicus TaxID=1317125 RepID=A0A1R3XB36_9BACT|nr:DUF5362 family protein [Pontibacter indicus]SIT88328.1 hypothetical protein SAMN05444128_1820 [Pontibacter indicus]
MEADLYKEQPQGLSINLDSREFLKNTARWGRFLAIIGFVFFGIMILGGLMGVFVTLKGDPNTAAALGNSLMSGGVFSLFYLVMAVLYFLPLLYLHKFSTKMLFGLEQNNEETVTQAFKNLKSLFKILGILTIAMLVFYAIMMIAVSTGAYFGSSRF